MYDAGPLIAASGDGSLRGERPRGSRVTAILAVLSLAAALVLAMLVRTGWTETPAASTPKPVASTVSAPVQRFDPERLIAADPAQVEALTRAQALAENAARPISALPNPAAPAFVLVSDRSPDYPRALACMTAAIYYEAAYEPVDGQRAVAQVVLNRLRHSLYPHSVCGVVFQGAERSSGCQFTFTCDGSLMRAPVPAVWARARAVAAQALSGFVFADVGLSTHYHANYVVPYWAGVMVKTAVVGQQTFYRMPDGYGRPPAFVSRYEEHEPQVAFGMATTLADVGGPAAGPETALDARPVLDNSGAAVAQTTPDPGGAMRTADLRKSTPRWIMGMDGNRSASSSSIAYETIN
ncbi:cell wall hydrolase [Novosphingobium sp. PhB165]|nr:cell wall hydrolase [Novosphingobium sp. PhB165]